MKVWSKSSKTSLYSIASSLSFIRLIFTSILFAVLPPVALDLIFVCFDGFGVVVGVAFGVVVETRSIVTVSLMNVETSPFAAVSVIFVLDEELLWYNFEFNCLRISGRIPSLMSSNPYMRMPEMSRQAKVRHLAEEPEV
jgi:hypothetical protein